MNDYGKIWAGATLGAVIGAAAAYLFFTPEGQQMRDRLEPAVDNLMSEFQKFRRTLEKVGDMANDGLRAFEEFQAARSQSDFGADSRTSH